MDLSKLPRLAQTPKESPPHAAPTPPPPNAIENPLLPRPGLAEAWISIGIGVVLLLIVPTTMQYLSSRLFHTTFAPFGDPERPPPAKVDYILFQDGSKFFYSETHFFWSDLVVTAFALVLILDGILMVRFRTLPIAIFALGLTIAATGANLIYVVMTYGSYGLAYISVLAVLFGGYIAISQWAIVGEMLRAAQKSAPDGGTTVRGSGGG